MSATRCEAAALATAKVWDGDTPPEPRRWTMFVILLVGAFLPPLDFFIVNVALPSIRGTWAPPPPPSSSSFRPMPRSMR